MHKICNICFPLTIPAHLYKFHIPIYIENILLVFRERPLYSFGYDPYEKKITQIVQIYWNLHAELPPTRYADFLKICHWTVTYMCLQKSPPFADFLKSATGQLPKLPTCACRNSPQWQISENLHTWGRNFCKHM